VQRTYKCLAVICCSLLSLSMSAPVRSHNIECPTITIDCPTNCLEAGETYNVTAKVSGVNPTAKLIYSWSVSSGTITAGQGTPTLTAVKLGGGETTTITVEVGGLDSSCQKTASCTLTICCGPISRQFDRYGDLAFADEKKRLDNFAEQLKNEPSSQAYIIVYGKQGARIGEAQVRADRARQYLIDKLGIGRERIVTVDGGIHVRFTLELWITPEGGVPPQPEDQEQ
jgi:hypothetical protein